MAINKSEYESEETTDSDAEILETALARFKLAEEAWSKIYRASLEDLRFLAGDQWPAEIRQAREKQRRPCLTINRMPQFIRQVTNDQRQNRPSIKVSPVDDKADIDTAKMMQGLTRNIETSSRADVAYDTAFESAVGTGIGFFRIMTDYVDSMSFDQELRFGRISDFTTVYIDPFSKEPDGSDADWGFIFSHVPHDAYKEEYKETELGNMTEWDSLSRTCEGWVSANSCRVAEYFYKSFKEITLVQVVFADQDPATGQTIQQIKIIDKSELPKDFPKAQIKAERKTKITVINHCKLNGLEILEKTVFPGVFIPIVPVYGNEIVIEGERILEGIVRHAKDSGQAYNFWATCETEMIALAPKAPFIVAEGQIPKEYEHMWRTANTETHATLTYKPTSLNGQPVGPPQRNSYEPPVQAITNARMQSADDLKATTGIYDSALGAQSREVSGIAIRGRQAQSQTSNFHFIDNLTRSIRQAGRIIIGALPVVYDAARTSRIIGEENEQEIVKINEFFQKNGEQKIYDPSVGKYDVDVETGPTYATKRQEAVASLLDLTKTYPKLMEIAGDLLVKNMDLPEAQALSERLKKTLPPGMAEDDKNEEKQQIPPEIQAHMQQLDQQNKELTEHLNAITDEVKTKKFELDSKERIEYAKLDVQMQIERLKLMGSAASAAFDAELQSIQRKEDGILSQERDQAVQPQSQDLNGAEPDQQAPTMQPQQQPTGGQSPGNITGV